MKKIKEKEGFTESVGIDVSKLTPSVHLYKRNKNRVFGNTTQKGFKEMKAWVSSQADSSQVLYCFEHTAWYCILLSHFLYDNGLDYYCVNPLDLKRSMGFKRGKTNKGDACELARFAQLRKEELKLSVPMPLKMIELQRLMSLREQFVKQCIALKNLEKGMLVTIAKPSTDAGIKLIFQSVRQLGLKITKVERLMEDLVKTEIKLEENDRLSQSVKGVGEIMALQMLLHTHNYSRFREWRQFSAYCGLVPYPHESGASIRGRRKIHKISDVKMKSLLSMTAISAIQHDWELKQYYQKRVEEEKLKMVALNIIRNKTVSRVFATVKMGTPYVELKGFTT